jgi:DNA-binding MarR family transcriptional regulator
MLASQKFTQALREWSEVFMHRSMRDFKRFMDDSGLSASQINTLMRLYHGGSCVVSEISDSLGITNAATSQMLERLVKQGLIERNEDLNDRRVRQITLTPKGQLLIDEGIKSRVLWLQELTRALNSQEQEAIVEALILLTEAARKIDV